LAAIALACAIGWALACASRPSEPDPSLATLWRDYQSLADFRAIAVAGNFRNDRWVAGVSGGHPSQADAEKAALAECRVRRLHAREQAMCQLYAVGDEIVWTGP
jgi:hypothetical protein